MGKARSFSDDSEDTNYQKQLDDELYSYSQQNSYNLGSVHFSDQSGIGNFSQSGSDQRKANLDGALFRGNIGFEGQNAVLDVATETIDLLSDDMNNPLSIVSTDKFLSLSTGSSANLVTILGAQRPGQRLILYGMPGNTITVKNTSGIVDNTIKTPGGIDLTVISSDTVELNFDASTSQWRVVGGSATGGGGGEFFGPWTGDHDAGTFNLTNFDSLIFQAGTPDGLAITDTGITGGDATGIKGNFLVGEEFIITEAGKPLFDVKQGFIRATSEETPPNLATFFNQATPVDGNEIGSIEFQGNNSVGGIHLYGSVGARIRDITELVEAGTLFLKASVAGSLSTFMEINPLTAVQGAGKVRFLRDIFMDTGDNISLDTGGRLILNHEDTGSASTDIRSTLTGPSTDIIIRQVGNIILKLGGTTQRALFSGPLINESTSILRGFLQFNELSTDPAAGTTSGKFYVKTVGMVAKPFFIGDGTGAVDLSVPAGGEFIGPWTEDHDAGTFNLKEFDSLIFQSGTPNGLAIGDTGITGGDAVGIRGNVLDGEEFIITEANKTIFDVKQGFIRATSEETPPNLATFFDQATPVDGNEIGSIEFQGNNSVGGIHLYGSVGARIKETEENIEEGTLFLKASVAGSLSTFMEINPLTAAQGEGKVRFLKDIFLDVGIDIFLDTSSRLILNNEDGIGATTDIRSTLSGTATDIIIRKDGGSILELGTTNSRARFAGPIVMNSSAITGGFIQFKELSANPADGSGTMTGKFYVKTVSNVAKPFFIGDGTAAVDLSASAATNLNSLTDVTITSPTTGQTLIFDGTAGLWKDQIYQGLDSDSFKIFNQQTSGQTFNEQTWVDTAISSSFNNDTFFKIMSAGDIFWVPLILTLPTSISAFGFYMQLNPVSQDRVIIGIYNNKDSPTSSNFQKGILQPQDLIFSSTQTLATVTRLNILSFTAQSLDPGIYWIAIKSRISSTGTSRFRAIPYALLRPILGYGDNGDGAEATFIGSGIGYAAVGDAGNALPNPASSGSNFGKLFSGGGAAETADVIPTAFMRFTNYAP